MPYIPHTPDDLQEMLSVVGVRTLDDLFADIPQDMRPKSFKLPKGQGEASVCAYFEDLAAKNRPEMISFLGAGYYAHQIPKAVDALAGRSEFYTAYTPYQAECSQGTLQAIFEFQTAISRLLDMDCANASVYDGGTALFEAAMMAVRATRRRVLVVDEAVNPIWRVMLGTYMSSLDLELKTVRQRDGVSDMDALMAAVDDNCAAVLVQNPNFFGAVADYTELFAKARAHKAFGIISVYPVMQAVLKTPGEMGADVAVAEAQSLAQRAHPPVPRPHRRPHHGSGRQNRLRADPPGPRAAHPPRQGHIQHLLQPGSLRPARPDPHEPAGTGRPDPPGGKQHGAGPLCRGAAHGPQGRGAAQRRALRQ